MNYSENYADSDDSYILQMCGGHYRMLRGVKNVKKVQYYN